jgi:hypothetical protein
MPHRRRVGHQDRPDGETLCRCVRADVDHGLAVDAVRAEDLTDD